MGRTSDARERLLQVAFELIWQQSYGSVSVDQICRRAKVKKGSFYYFFPSKSDLAVAAYEEYWKRSQPNYERIFSPLVPPLQRLEDYCAHVYESQREKYLKTGCVLGCPFACLGAELSTQDEKIRTKSLEMFERLCRFYETTLRDAFNQGLIEKTDFVTKSHAIFCQVMGALLQAKVKNDPEVLRNLAPNILQMIGATVPA
jgi:TetR/AcrR family transcriptional repressor of nem operon